jgi:catechol 2,3-dioxygenase-like lactoylglutathione lyase family enzyme
MQARGITWAGTRTRDVDGMVEFLERRLGLSRSHAEPEFVALALPNGDAVEVFSADDPDHRHFTTGPVVGFEVDDVAQGRSELADAGVELIGPMGRGGGLEWQHFRGPDGNVWEITRRKERNRQ